MKKLYSLLALALLTLLSATTVAAQEAVIYLEGDQITDAAEAVGHDVVLKSYNFSKYWAGTNVSENITDNCIWTISATGETCDGHPTYTLMQKSTKLYLADFALDGADDTTDMNLEACPTTEDPSLAMKFTILLGQSDDETDQRSYAMVSEGFNNHPGNGGMVFSRDKLDAGRVVALMNYANRLHLSVYHDTNLIDIFTVTEADGYTTLTSYIQQYFPNGVNEDSYNVGQNPGQVSQDLFNEALELYNTANDMLFNDANTDKEYRQMAYQLKVMAERLVSESIPMQEGYYLIHDGRAASSWAYGNDTQIGCTTEFTRPEVITPENAAYVWKVEKGGTEGTWYIKNWSLDHYVSTKRVGSAFTLSDTPSNWTITTAQWGIAETGGAGIPIPAATFNIYNDTEGVCWNSYRQGYKGYIGNWNDKTDVGNCYFFEVVNPEDLKGLEDLVAQQALNAKLETLYNSVKNTKSKNLSYTSAATRDQHFDDMGLVTDPEALVSNQPCSSEGSYAGLLDGDFTTYFHTEWVGESHDPENGAHYIQADLGQAVEALQIKYAQRIGQYNNCEPTLMDIFATNDPEGEWTAEGQVSMKYDIEATFDVNGNETHIANMLGIAGFSLSQPYRYVRLACVDYMNPAKGQAFAGHLLWYLSELHFYEAQFDPAASNYYVASEAVRTEFEEALQEAADALEDGAATQETIDRLQAAYDALVAELPTTDALVAAIEAATSEWTSAPVGEGIGYYTQEAKDAYKAAIDAAQAVIDDNTTYTVSMLQAAVEALAKATAQFRAQIGRPEAGQYYYVRSATTSNAANTAALLYAYNSNKNGGLRVKPQVQAEESEEKVDDVDLRTALSYLWYCESANEAGITLRNMGTGLYLAGQEAKNSAVTCSEEPFTLGMKSAGAAGVVNLIVGEGLYMNVSGVSLMAWDAASGTDNSAFTFSPAALANLDGDGLFSWPVNANTWQIITLPIAIDGIEGEGTLYKFNGVNADNELVFTEYEDREEIPAGHPFLFKSEAEQNLLKAYGTRILADDKDLEWAYEGMVEDGFAGTVCESVLLGSGFGHLLNGNFTVTVESYQPYTRTVGCNSGFIQKGYKTTDLEGDVCFSLGTKMIDNTWDAILNVETAQPIRHEVYTLAGLRLQHVKNLPAGLYIINGKKVIVK